MKIAIPTVDKKLCAHFGHSETFTFAEVDEKEKKIIKIYTMAPEEGVSCHSTIYLYEQGVDVVLAGGMGPRPLSVLQENNIQVVLGCPEIDTKEIVELYLGNKIQNGKNSCGGENHHQCHHGEGHHCGGHH